LVTSAPQMAAVMISFSIILLPYFLISLRWQSLGVTQVP